MTDILKDAKEFWGYERDKDRQEVSMYFDKYHGFRLIEEVERLREDRDRWKKQAEYLEEVMRATERKSAEVRRGGFRS